MIAGNIKEENDSNKKTRTFIETFTERKKKGTIIQSVHKKKIFNVNKTISMQTQEKVREGKKKDIQEHGTVDGDVITSLILHYSLRRIYEPKEWSELLTPQLSEGATFKHLIMPIFLSTLTTHITLAC